MMKNGDGSQAFFCDTTEGANYWKMGMQNKIFLRMDNRVCAGKMGIYGKLFVALTPSIPHLSSYHNQIIQISTIYHYIQI